MPEDVHSKRDAVLLQWLGEAHSKEAELEADLTAHIALTTKPAYKKRLQTHLTETQSHKRRLAARIKKLGGQPTDGPLPASVPHAIGELAGKATAAVKTQVGTVRAALTDQSETHLRNAREELREEHVEITLYSAIETLAEQLGDADTAKTARQIRAEEERMAKYLTQQIPMLVKELVRAQIPRDQRPRRPNPTRRPRFQPSARAGRGRTAHHAG